MYTTKHHVVSKCLVEKEMTVYNFSTVGFFFLSFFLNGQGTVPEMSRFK